MIDGVSALIAVMHADAGLTALVPTARIMSGVLPKGTRLPAIALDGISTVERGTLSHEPTGHVAERVQATMLAATYREVRAIIKALRRLDHAMPADDAISHVVVRIDGAGPDFMEEDSQIHGKTQDFRVSYTEAR
jgi:hypothetical protein